LRIYDLDEDEQDEYASPQASNSIVNSLKRTNTSDDTVREDPSEGASIGKVRAETDSTKLRNFINNLGEE
jgi:hypothetical protein